MSLKNRASKAFNKRPTLKFVLGFGTFLSIILVPIAASKSCNMDSSYNDLSTRTADISTPRFTVN